MPSIERPAEEQPLSGYLPCLDGWRAIAIFAVMMLHDDLHRWGPFSTQWFYLHGGHGVDLFFAISGILICSRLLEEERLYGTISLGRFYIRRVFRIIPPALTYLLALAALTAFSVIHVERGEWFAALLFFRNYSRLMGHLHGTAYFTTHFWSLSLEEHFYFLLPGLLVFVPKRLHLTALATFAGLIMANRAFQLHHRDWATIRFHTDVRMDALLVPAALAVIVHTGRWKQLLTPVLRHWMWLALLILLIIPFGVGSFLQLTALILLMPLLVMGSILYPQTWLGKLLEARPMRFIGKISYSLYLWQMLFFVGHDGGYTTQWRPLGLLEFWPINLAATFACALASYYLVEQPMIRIGHRFAPSRQRGR